MVWSVLVGHNQAVKQ